MEGLKWPEASWAQKLRGLFLDRTEMYKYWGCNLVWGKSREEYHWSQSSKALNQGRQRRTKNKSKSKKWWSSIHELSKQQDRQVHRTRTRHPERKSKSEGHCGSYRAGGERRNLQVPTHTQELSPTSAHSNGFCITRVCISSSSSKHQLGGNRQVSGRLGGNAPSSY
jgi:hypothetical protein